MRVPGAAALAALAVATAPSGANAFPDWKFFVPNGRTNDWHPGGNGDRLTLLAEEYGRITDPSLLWTPESCARDADGDGFTNAEELGDKDCAFVPNSGELTTPEGRVSDPNDPASTPDNPGEDGGNQGLIIALLGIGAAIGAGFLLYQKRTNSSSTVVTAPQPNVVFDRMATLRRKKKPSPTESDGTVRV